MCKKNLSKKFQKLKKYLNKIIIKEVIKLELAFKNQFIISLKLMHKKGKFKFFIPYSAEDFTGLIYPTLTKGKLGDKQMAWYKKNLLDPFARAENAITNERHQRMKDFHALKKEISDVPKNIRKKFKDNRICYFHQMNFKY